MNEPDMKRLWAFMKSIRQHDVLPDPNDPISMQAWMMILGPYEVSACIQAVGRIGGSYSPSPIDIRDAVDPPPSQEDILLDMKRVILSKDRVGGLHHFGVQVNNEPYAYPVPSEFSSEQSFAYWSEGGWRRVREAAEADTLLTESRDAGTTLSVQRTAQRKDIAAFQERVPPAKARAICEAWSKKQLGDGDGPDLLPSL